jgi:hypothetical protein
MTDSSVGNVGTGVNASRPDIMIAPTAARPTPKPPRVSFGEVLAAGAGVAVQGASTVLSALPGSSMSAPGVRQAGAISPMVQPGGALTAEGPGTSISPSGLPTSLSTGTTGTGTGVSLGGVSVGGSESSSSTDSASSINAALQQSAQLNLYYLQIQQQEDAQNRQFTAESNIEKTRHDTAKNAIGNVGQ